MFWLVLVVFQTLLSANLATGLIHAGIGSAIVAFVLVRFGFLAFIFTQYFIFLQYPGPAHSEFVCVVCGIHFLCQGPGHRSRRLCLLHFACWSAPLQRRTAERYLIRYATKSAE